MKTMMGKANNTKRRKWGGWSGVEWGGVGWSGVEWGGVGWSGVEWGGVGWSGVE